MDRSPQDCLRRAGPRGPSKERGEGCHKSEAPFVLTVDGRNELPLQGASHDPAASTTPPPPPKRPGPSTASKSTCPAAASNAACSNPIKIRCSQINGCAFCLDMHTKDARASGETEQRIYTLSAWHETPFFSDRERAALAWVERRHADRRRGAPSDALYEKTREQFSEKEIADLTWAAVAINGWNRIALSFRQCCWDVSAAQVAARLIQRDARQKEIEHQDTKRTRSGRTAFPSLVLPW